MPSSSFTTVRVNETTFAITEDDSFGEHPIIYCLIHPTLPLIILSDTGCDSPSDDKKNAKYTHLLEYLRHCPIAENDNKPLDHYSGARSYVIICTHCHYDHINGIEQFATLRDSNEDHSSPTTTTRKTEIVAPAAGRSFIETDLPTHSLCRYLNIPTPKYKITHWATQKERLRYRPTGNSVISKHHISSDDDDAETKDIGITILSTPGHTPDELAWYDHAQQHLYVGDTFYALGSSSSNPKTYSGPIIFPTDGDWIAYMKSLYLLYDFVDLENWRNVQAGTGKRVLVGCGHTTTAEDAEGMILEVIGFFERVLRGEVGVVERSFVRGEVVATWAEEGGRFAVRSPERLCEDARKEKGLLFRMEGERGDVGSEEWLDIEITHSWR